MQNRHFSKKIKYIVVFYAIILFYASSKKILSIYNIEYRSWFSDIMSMAMITGISITVIYLLVSFNRRFFNINDSAKNYIIIVVLIAFAMVIDFCFHIIKIVAVILVFMPLVFLKKSKILYIFNIIIIGLLLRVFSIFTLDLLFHHLAEKPYDCNYIEVVDETGEGFTKGLYKPLNFLLRRKITVDYGMEELLEYRYGMKFEMWKEDDQVYYVPESYPQLKLKLCNPYYGMLDFSDSLARWCFEKTYKENNMKMDYMYKPGYWMVANDIFCPIIDETGDFDLYADEIAEMIRCANADSYFQSDKGVLECVIMLNGNIEDYVSFTFGSEIEGGKEDFYENPDNVMDEIKKYHICISKYDGLNQLEFVALSQINKTEYSIEIKIENKTNGEICYSEQFELNVLIDNVWYICNPKAASNSDGEPIYQIFDDIAYTIEKGESMTVDYPYRKFFGDIQPGTYRIVVPIRIVPENKEYYFSCEFEIE